jgi:hypothetical protein
MNEDQDMITKLGIVKGVCGKQRLFFVYEKGQMKLEVM